MNNHKVIATDNFNRANAANLGANWSVGLSGNIPEILSNQAANRVANANNDAFWNTQAFDNGQYAQALCVQRNLGADDFSGVAVHMNGSDYVAFRIHQSLGRVELVWYNSGAFTVLANDGGSTGDPQGKVFTLEVFGTTYYAYLNGVLVFQVNNSSTPPSGSPGLITWGTNAGQSLWDNFEAGTIPSPTGQGVVRGIKYFSVDVMKETKDTVNGQPPDSDIMNLVTAIYGGLKPTHMAVSMPLDPQADFITNGNFPSPRTVDANFKIWFDTIHASGAKVMYRGTFSNMENIYNFPFLPDGNPGFIPQGTAASAPTDGNTTWLGKMYQRILQIGTNFKPGDIWAPFPEQTSYVFSSQSFLSGTPSLNDNFAQFFADVVTVSQAAFAKIGIDGIVFGLTSNNYSEVRSGWLESSVFSNAGVIALDYYGNYNNDGYAPYQYYVDIQAVSVDKGFPVFWEEWGDLQTESSDYATRLTYFDAVCAQIAQMVTDGFLIGFNYWGGWADQNTSILDQNADGTYQLNGQGLILAKYFNPPPQTILNPKNGVGKSARSKYEIQAWINGQLFANLTGIAQDRQFTLTRNDADDIQFSLNLDAFEQYCREIQVNSQDVLQAGVTEIRVLRNGVVLTAGQIFYWDVELADERKITVNAKGWLELLKYRISNNQWSNMTVLQIMQAELAATQAMGFGDMGLTFGLTPSPDSTNLYGVKTYSQKNLYDMWLDFTKEDNGIDLEISWDKKINVYSPRMGTTRSDVVFSYPGNITDIKITNDITKMGNYFTARGTGYGLNDVTLSDLTTQQKYGLRQALADFSDIDDQSQLDNLTTAELALFKNPIILNDVTLDGIQVPVGSFRLGDMIRTSVSNILPLYAGVNGFFKVDQMIVTVGAEDDEKIEVSTNAPV